MATVDKVEFLRKNGPLPQYGTGVKLNKDGSLAVADAIKIKAKGSPKKAK